ncbi:MAG TPA: hypothetical protein VMT87_01355, partial [Vicinamibacteria bacterium]|nr:hypothetical protein [Vicinamibacteria bacterium]
EAFELEEEGGASAEELPVRFIEEPSPELPAAETGFNVDQEEEEIALDAPVPSPPSRAQPPAPARPVPPARAAPAKARPAPPRPPAGGAPAELVRALEEVEQYVSLGFVDDARDALRDLVGRYPGHVLLAAKVAELGLEAEPAEEPAYPTRYEAPAAEASDDAFAELGLPDYDAGTEPLGGADDLLGAREIPGDGHASRPAAASSPAAFGAEEAGGLDLGSELGELFGAQSAVEEAGAGSATELGDSGLADIFKEFKKGVDKQLGKEDYDTRYNLGIAYKEMGLVDEAIAEFQLAAKDETRVLECASMLGICFLEKGMPKLAVKWFEKGLLVAGRSDEEYQGLRYDLAVAHEASGETDKALSLFTDLYGQDANFRDVAAKVRELGGA